MLFVGLGAGASIQYDDGRKKTLSVGNLSHLRAYVLEDEGKENISFVIGRWMLRTRLQLVLY